MSSNPIQTALSVQLAEAIYNDELRSIHFFNGRLLSSEDLVLEQGANRNHHRLLGRAVGSGVAWGLEVSGKLGDTSGAVDITPGLAVNRSGRALALPKAIHLALQQTTTPATASGDTAFAPCTPQPPVSNPKAAGVCLLVMSPVEDEQGSAPVSGLGNAPAACNTAYETEGVCFRLLAATSYLLDGFLTGADLADVPHLRNALAHACFGTTVLKPTPFGDPQARYGVLDKMLALAECDVPLALVCWNADGTLAFLDAWSVRRRVTTSPLAPNIPPPAEEPVPRDQRWVPILGDRRRSEAEAMFLQFQDQVNAIRAEETAAVVASLRAADRFRYLPPAGYLPTGTGGFDALRFLGDLAPGSMRKVEPGLLRALLHRSLAMDPVPVVSPPGVPVNVYQPSSGDPFVLFARSEDARLRLSFATPVPAQVPAVSITAGNFVYAPAQTPSSVYPLTADVPGGKYRLSVTAQGYDEYQQDREAVAGQTDNLTLALSLKVMGEFHVSLQDQTGKPWSGAVSAVTAEGGGKTKTGAWSGGYWGISPLDPGDYVIRVTASGAQPYVSASLHLAAGQSYAFTAKLAPRETPPKRPPRYLDVKSIEAKALVDIEIYLVLESARYRGQPYQLLSAAEIRQGGREVALIYKQSSAGKSQAKPPSGSQPATSGYVKVTLPKDVHDWLDLWRKWLGATQHLAGVGDAEPEFYIDTNYSPAALASKSAQMPAYVTFGELVIPVLITPLSGMTKKPVAVGKGAIKGVDPSRYKRLKKGGIYTIDQLKSAPLYYVKKILGDPPEYCASLIRDAGDAAEKINQGFGYLEGMDSGILKVLNDNGIDDPVGLANADVAALGRATGQPGLVVRLVSQMRQLVPKESWSAATLPLNSAQREALAAKGVTSLGDFQRVATDAGARKELGQELVPNIAQEGDRVQFVTGLYMTAITDQTVGSILALGSKNIVELPGASGAVADKLAEANIRSVDALAGAKAEDLAAQTGLPAGTLAILIAGAQKEAAAGMDAARLAPAGAAGVAAVLPSVGQIADDKNFQAIREKAPSAEFAQALVAGVKAGLARRMR